MPTQGSSTIIEAYVCTNDRKGTRKSCADGGAEKLKATLAAKVSERGLTDQIKIDTGGCLGACEDGPNIMVYPQGKMYCQCELSDVPQILNELIEFTGK